jgi:hypothetical protein
MDAAVGNPRPIQVGHFLRFRCLKGTGKYKRPWQPSRHQLQIVDMADKTEIPEHTTKDLEAESLNPDTIDEAAIALKHIATRDMAPITDEENHQILKKIDFYLMPIVSGPCLWFNGR